MPLWFQTETRVRTHPKMLVAGRAACWTWVCGNCYAKDQMTDGFIPEAMLASLVPGVPLREVRRDADKLVSAGLWKRVEGGFSINDFLEYNESKAQIEARLERDRQRKRSKEIPDGKEKESERIPLSVSESGSVSGSEKAEDRKKPHPIRDLLGLHQQLFMEANEGEKPAEYSDADVAGARRLLKRGEEPARQLVRQAFKSTDQFIAKSGRSMALIGSTNVMNKLISELAASKPKPVAQRPASLRVIDEMESKRHAG